MNDDPRSTEPRRSSSRKGVLRKVKIAFGTSTIDAVMLNVSETGAKIWLPSEVPVPERATLTYAANGESVAVTRAWQSGDEVGFSFDGPSMPEESPAGLAWRAAHMVQALGLDVPMRLLRGADFFYDDGLRAAAEAAEAAVRRLGDELVSRASAFAKEDPGSRPGDDDETD